MRATASAILLFILNMVGLGAGPFLVGILNDQLDATYGSEAIRYSLLLATLVAAAGSIFFWIAGGTLREDLASRDA